MILKDTSSTIYSFSIDNDKLIGAYEVDDCHANKKYYGCLWREYHLLIVKQQMQHY